MICDQQNIDKNNFDVSYLPKHVQVVFFNRSELRKKVYSGTQGKLIKLMANYKLSLPLFYQKKITQLIFNQALAVNLTINELNSANLYLYNDRNKMSRLFRLAFNYYHLIEEGVGNYYGNSIKNHEKLISFITGSKKTKRFFGDDERCKSIYLINAESAPKELKSKVKKIDFINSNYINDYCYDFFKVSTDIHPQCILATQPSIFSDVDMAIYKKIILKCKQKNITVAIKPHPREDISYYLAAFPDTLVIESKIPLELVLFRANKDINILSICSSAGLGFEDYCSRLPLIKDDELDNVLYSKSTYNIESLSPRIDTMFAEL